MIYMILFSAIFSSTMILSGFSLGDAFGVIVILYAFIQKKFSFQYISPRNHNGILMFLVWILFSTAIVFFISDVNVIEFAKSYLKLIFYVIFYYSAYTILRNTADSKIFSQVSTILMLNSIIAMYIFFAMYLKLPYEFFWIGLDVPITTAYFGGSLFVRARGLFTEPAYLGYFLVLGQAFLILNGYKQRSLRLIINWFVIVLTFSVTTYFLALIVLGLYYKKNVKKILNMSLLILIVSTLIYSIPGIRDAIQLSVINRVVGVINNDSAQSSSANVRIQKTWEIALDNLSESYYFGSGLGNHAISFARVNNLDINSEVIESHNVLAYVLGTTGVVGIILFLSLFYVFRNKKSLGAVFFASLFVNGYFLSLTFWVMYSLFSLNLNKQKSRV